MHVGADTNESNGGCNKVSLTAATLKTQTYVFKPV